MLIHQFNASKASSAASKEGVLIVAPSNIPLSNFLFLANCGYQSVYFKNDDTLIKISKIKFEGDEKINRKILSLTGVKESSDFSDSYLLILNSKKN